jgi:transcriptional regulator with XRE-family HTH domain
VTDTTQAPRRSVQSKKKKTDTNRSVRFRFGKRLQELRLHMGFSQEELCSRAAVNRTYLSDLERGQGNATLEVMTRLSCALGLSLSQLLVGVDGAEQPAATVLVALAAVEQAAVRKALTRHNATWCRDMKDAKRLLEDVEFDVIVSSTSFSKGQVLELLKMTRASTKNKSTPFICITEVAETANSTVFSQAVELAVRALGGTVLLTSGLRAAGELSARLQQLIEKLAVDMK